jgi:cytosine/adenosine deaminase-related metal-dependent hydrolase
VDEVDGVARAAREVGVRIGFAVAMNDRNAIAYCDEAQVLPALREDIRAEVAGRLRASAATPAEQLARVDEVGAMLDAGGHGDHVTLQYGPNGVQWCSTPLLSAIAQASADTGRPIHMHLLETRYQRDWADANFPHGVVRHLDEIGLLSPRLTLAHCTWTRPDELALLAERGVAIAVNTSSNLGLRSGIAPLAEMLRQGCRVAMGLDGLALDEDDDALREMRLAYAMHRGWGYEAGMSVADLWRFAAGNGRRSVSGLAGGQDGGRIAAGQPADLVVLDWDDVDDDAIFDIDPHDLLLARAHGGHIRQVFVGGRKIVDDAKVITVDEQGVRAEMIAQVRGQIAGNPGFRRWHEVVDAMADDLGPFYRQRAFLGCC